MPPQEQPYSYDSNMMYGFGQPGPTQAPFEVVPQYQTRPVPIDALANPFVPQYFASEDSAGSGLAGIPSYLNAQLQPYNQTNPMARPVTTQSFPANVTDFTIGSGSMSRFDQPEPQQSDPSSLDEAIGQYQSILRHTFDQTRAGRLVEASGSLLRISKWLVDNARRLGKMLFFSSSSSALICPQKHALFAMSLGSITTVVLATGPFFLFVV
jgi:hypothetical protein